MYVWLICLAKRERRVDWGGGGGRGKGGVKGMGKIAWGMGISRGKGRSIYSIW